MHPHASACPLMICVFQSGPFQPDLAISHILAKLMALQQEIRYGGCVAQQLMDQYYLEPGYL